MRRHALTGGPPVKDVECSRTGRGAYGRLLRGGGSKPTTASSARSTSARSATSTRQSLLDVATAEPKCNDVGGREGGWIGVDRGRLFHRPRRQRAGARLCLFRGRAGPARRLTYSRATRHGPRRDEALRVLPSVLPLYSSQVALLADTIRAPWRHQAEHQ